MVRGTLTIIVVLAWLLWLNWQLTAITFVLVPPVALVVRADGQNAIEIRLRPTAVALPTVVAEGRTELDARRQSTGFSMNEIQRDAIDEASRRGMTLWELLRDDMPQVEVREASRGIAACVEFRGAVRLTGGHEDRLPRRDAIRPPGDGDRRLPVHHLHERIVRRRVLAQLLPGVERE